MLRIPVTAQNSSLKVKSGIWMKGCTDLPVIQGVLPLKGSAELAGTGNEPISFLLKWNLLLAILYLVAERDVMMTLHSNTCSEINVGFPTFV